jgi:hypothetical protein
MRKLGFPAICSAFTIRIISRTNTIGVRTTAKANLNISARDFAIPKNIPVEIVAPDRENPRNGRQRPCTAPMIAAS